MIVRIPKANQVALLEVCAVRNIQVDFFTDEKADGLCIVEVHNVTPEIAFYIGAAMNDIVRDQQEQEAKGDALFNMLKVNFGSNAHS
jgi:hypothetical protein